MMLPGHGCIESPRIEMLTQSACFAAPFQFPLQLTSRFSLLQLLANLRQHLHRVRHRQPAEQPRLPDRQHKGGAAPQPGERIVQSKAGVESGCWMCHRMLSCHKAIFAGCLMCTARSAVVELVGCRMRRDRWPAHAHRSSLQRDASPSATCA